MKKYILKAHYLPEGFSTTQFDFIGRVITKQGDGINNPKYAHTHQENEFESEEEALQTIEKFNVVRMSDGSKNPIDQYQWEVIELNQRIRPMPEVAINVRLPKDPTSFIG